MKEWRLAMPPPVVCITSALVPTSKLTYNEPSTSAALSYPNTWTNAANGGDFSWKHQIVSRRTGWWSPPGRQGRWPRSVSPGLITTNSIRAVCYFIWFSFQSRMLLFQSTPIPFNSDLANEMFPFYKKKAVCERTSHSKHEPWIEIFTDTIHRRNWNALVWEGNSKQQFKLGAYFNKNSQSSPRRLGDLLGHQVGFRPSWVTK